MRKFFFIFILLFLGFAFSQPEEKMADDSKTNHVINNLKTEIQIFKDDPEVSAALNEFINEVTIWANELTQKIEQFTGESSKTPEAEAEKPVLKTPDKQIFSIHNIEMGDDKTEVESQLGSPKRSSLNEYGTEWHAYHENYQNFVMVAYDKENKVAGLYTNQDLISSTKEMTYGTPKTAVLEQLGKPMDKMRKGFVLYQLEQDRDYELFNIDGNYVTVFYDKHRDNTVTSIQIIDETLEQQKKSFYKEPSIALKEGFEYQLFDLTNADRVNHGVSVLTWDEHVRETARKHSLDMAENNYFDHTNLEGLSPFDRMQADEVSFMVAGENLASGQFSSIFAHEGLMNSMGHRKNILRPDYEYLGVGVAFNSQSQPYYTENFYAN
ncbi:CAP domain-containing protein [Cytobacillus oceanisediminis]|uniref:CAP domain-containing protein n=1 Tax=Cytobacillus oceanisediminis TaxID=665099 RepID=UPI003736F224